MKHKSFGFDTFKEFELSKKQKKNITGGGDLFAVLNQNAAQVITQIYSTIATNPTEGEPVKTGSTPNPGDGKITTDLPAINP